MKILIIGLQNSGSRSGYMGLFMPLGVAYITAALKKYGFTKIDCVDLHIENILRKNKVSSLKPLESFDYSSYDVIGFGGPFFKFSILKDLSHQIWKTNKSIFQVAGGNMATSISDIILKETNINCVCLFEGEETIVELLKSIEKKENWKNVKGIKYLNENKDIVETKARAKIKYLDSIAYPDRGNWYFEITKKYFPVGSPGRYCAVLIGSRGCPFSCTFCNPQSGRILRKRSPRNIVDEIIVLKNKWNIQYFRFFDEVFIGSKKAIKELCEIIIEEDLNIFWWCQTQIRLINEDLLAIMKKAGCIEISFGIESGSNIILAEMKKGITKEESKRIIELTDQSGIRPTINLLAGTPSETLETIKETKDFIISLNYIDWVQIPAIHYIVPLPGTELFDIAVEKGAIIDKNNYSTTIISNFSKHTHTINLTNIPNDVLLAYIKQCNLAIEKDFYLKHPIKRFLSFFGLDHLRLDLIFKHLSIYQIKPLVESLLWATIGKRNNLIGRFIASLIYR